MRCSRRTVCMVATNEYRPCVWCEPLLVRAIGFSFGGLTSNGSHATHHTHGTARRLPHGYGQATCARVPAWDLCRVPATVSHHGAQPPRERTSTTVDGSGSQSECNPLPGPSDCHQDPPGAPGISVHNGGTVVRNVVPGSINVYNTHVLA